MIDKHLEDKLKEKLSKLLKKIDWIGDKELRQKLEYHALEIGKLIKENASNETIEGKLSKRKK